MDQGDSTPSRAERIVATVDDLIDQRSHGIGVRDEDVCAAHPDLLPELQEALRRLHIVERASLMAREFSRAEAEFDTAQSQPVLVEAFDVLREINRGGQAIVYLARHRTTGDLAAIKVLQLTERNQDVQHERFENEITALASLRHPGIVPVLQHGHTADGRPYLAMPYIEGEDLNPGRIAREMPLRQRLKLFLSICRAIAAAHDRGIVHRDLKPSNIRIDGAGAAHLLDFGLARAPKPDELRHSLTVTGQFIGTILWCSPEQLRGEQETTAASDVYSLGVLLHQLLANGQHPQHAFDNLQRAAGGNVAADKSATDASLIEPDASPLAPLVLKCLASEPADRPQSAGALANELEALLDNRRAWRPPTPRKRRWIVAVGVVLLLAVASWPIAQKLTRVRHQPPEFNGRLPIDVTYEGATAHLVWIPPGEFLMGSRPGDPGMVDERQHRVHIRKGFYVCTQETDQLLYEKVMGRNPARFVKRENPVERVSWFDAQEFCRRFSEKLHRRVRLPTETEWEYACRAGSAEPFVTGRNIPALVRYANLGDESCPEPLAYRVPYNDGAPYTWTVGTGLQNAWGLQNMHGNVWEWCQDVYAAYPKDESDDVVPTTAPSADEPVQMNTRGGSWWDAETSATASHRNPMAPGKKVSTLGFRIVIEE